MNKRGSEMDELIVLLVIIMLLAIAAICIALYGKATEFYTRNYERRTKINQEYDTALLQAARVLVVGKFAFVAKGVDSSQQIVYDKYPIDDAGTPIAAQMIDGTVIDKHRLAATLIDDSIGANGAGAAQLLTDRQWKKMGHPQEEHSDALEYMSGLGLIKIKNGGNEQGTFVKSGTLQTLLRDLAVNALPLATGQKVTAPPRSGSTSA